MTCSERFLGLEEEYCQASGLLDLAVYTKQEKCGSQRGGHDPQTSDIAALIHLGKSVFSEFLDGRSAGNAMYTTLEPQRV